MSAANDAMIRSLFAKQLTWKIGTVKKKPVHESAHNTQKIDIDILV